MTGYSGFAVDPVGFTVEVALHVDLNLEKVLAKKNGGR